MRTAAIEPPFSFVRGGLCGEHRHRWRTDFYTQETIKKPADAPRLLPCRWRISDYVSMPIHPEKSDCNKHASDELLGFDL